MLLLPTHERETRLHAPALEVQIEWHERESLPFDRADEATDFTAVHEQLARAGGLVIEHIALPVRPDMQVEQEHLVVLDHPEGIGQVRAPFTQRLDLRAGEHDTALPGVQDFVVVPRTLVPRDQFSRFFGVRVCHTERKRNTLTRTKSARWR